MRRGDIYFVSLDPTVDHEQPGSRPLLVVSPAPFNRLTRTPVVLPITTGGNFARTAGFAVVLSGTKTTGVVRCDQPRALDLAARNGRRVESVPSSVLDDLGEARDDPSVEEVTTDEEGRRPLGETPAGVAFSFRISPR